MHLTYRINYGYVIYDIVGNIPYEESEILEEYVKDNFPQDYKNAIFNMEKVPYINSSALSVFIKILKFLEAKGIKVYMMNVNEEIYGLLKLTGVHKFFKYIKDEKMLVERQKRMELDSFLNEEPL